MSQFPPPLTTAGGRIRQRLLVALVGIGIVLVAAWLSLIILTRIDELFLPGELNVGAFTAVPGVEEPGEGATERINILIMGLDRRPRDGDAPARTDTLFVLTIDPQSETAGILGIPRDLWVEYPYRSGNCCYQRRINAAYVLGETEGYDGGGPGLAIDVVERNLGIPIDHYIVIDFEGFKEIIDALGGVTIYIENDLYDPFYSDTEERGDYFSVDFKEGETVEMDGRTALAYARVRRGYSDFDRINRQQKVIFAALAKAQELGFNDVSKVPGLWSDYKDAIETDVNDLLILRYAGLASKIDPTRITALSIGAYTRPWTTPQEASVLLADKELVQELVQALFNDYRLINENAHVEVQNGVNEDGLATRVIDFLDLRGFAAISLTAANTVDGRIRPQTEIIDFSGKSYTVERLAAVLGVSEGLIRPAQPEDSSLRTTGDADILIILGSDTQEQDLAVGDPDG